MQNQETKCNTYVGFNSVSGGTQLTIPLFSNGGPASGVANPFQDFPLQFIDVSTGKSGRIGTQITLKGMHMSVQLQQDATSQWPLKVRMLLAWIDPNQGTITSANLLESITGVTGNDVVTAQLIGPSRPNTIIRKVVFDRIYDVYANNPPYNATTNLQALGTKQLKFNIPFNNKKYQFINTSTGSDGEFEDLALFAWGWAPGQANTVQVANMRISNRIYYKDG